MRSRYSFYCLISFLLLTPTTSNAETTTFLGIQSVEIETTLDYADGSEDYEFTGTRLQFGAEFSEGGVAGIEITSGDTDETIDPFGTPFELETKPAFGIFANMGRPFYFRLGWTVWDTEYTNLNTDVTVKEEVSTIDYGIGIQLPIGKHIKVYADYVKRNTNAKYAAHFIGEGDIEYDSDIVSLGLSASF